MKECLSWKKSEDLFQKKSDFFFQSLATLPSESSSQTSLDKVGLVGSVSFLIMGRSSSLISGAAAAPGRCDSWVENARAKRFKGLFWSCFRADLTNLAITMKHIKLTNTLRIKIEINRGPLTLLVSPKNSS